MIASLQPAPFRVPFLNAKGEMDEQWRRFFLTNQSLINTILNSLKAGSQPGMVDMESSGGSDIDAFGFAIPGPPGPAGAAGPPGPSGSGTSAPGMDGLDGDDALWSMIQVSTSGGGGSSALQWTLLTNGDLIEPELIFADGDVIWVNVP